MGIRNRLLLAVIGGMLLRCGASAQGAIRWQPTLEGAKRVAAQTDRLVLIHFWADYCAPCRQMEQEVLSQPSVASELEANYVAVKLNASHFPATSRQYQVTALPTDVILTAQGQEVSRIQGVLGASEYVARMNGIAASRRGRSTGMYAQIPGGSPPAGAGPGAAPRAGPGYSAPYSPSYSPPAASGNLPTSNPLAGPRQAVTAPVSPQYGQMASADRGSPGYVPIGSTAGMPGGAAGQYGGSYGSSPRTQPSMPPGQAIGSSALPSSATPSRGLPGNPTISSPASESDNPPLGLDGHCPVELSEKSTWTLGDRRWGARHRGRTYLFAGPEQRARFFEAPDRYAPVLSGNDVVLSTDRGQTVAGRREHGVFFGGRVYLFSSEESLEQFSKAPNRYANEALQAMRVGMYPRWPMR